MKHKIYKIQILVNFSGPLCKHDKKAEICPRHFGNGCNRRKARKNELMKG